MFFNLPRRYNYLIMAIILANFGKPLFLLMIVWDYPLSFIVVLNVFLLSSLVVSLKGTVTMTLFDTCLTSTRSVFEQPHTDSAVDRVRELCSTIGLQTHAAPVRARLYCIHSVNIVNCDTRKFMCNFTSLRKR
jgi:hypothetical protein